MVISVRSHPGSIAIVFNWFGFRIGDFHRTVTVNPTLNTIIRDATYHLVSHAAAELRNKFRFVIAHARRKPFTDGTGKRHIFRSMKMRTSLPAQNSASGVDEFLQ
jgi:hypothetical protein